MEGKNEVCSEETVNVRRGDRGYPNRFVCVSVNETWIKWEYFSMQRVTSVISKGKY
jgi:hypothetical protein